MVTTPVAPHPPEDRPDACTWPKHHGNGEVTLCARPRPCPVHDDEVIRAFLAPMLTVDPDTDQVMLADEHQARAPGALNLYPYPTDSWGIRNG